MSFDIHETFDLEAGEAVSLDCSHDCEVLFLSELEFARWQKTGAPEPWVYTRMPISMVARSPGKWHLLATVLPTSSMADMSDVQPQYSVSR
jgi:hypothetical protein